MDRWTGGPRQTDGRTDRRTDRSTDRQADRDDEDAQTQCHTYRMQDLSDEKDAEALTKVNENIANPNVEALAKVNEYIANPNAAFSIVAPAADRQTGRQAEGKGRQTGRQMRTSSN